MSDYLGLSDEEILNMPAPDLSAGDEENENTDEISDSPENENNDAIADDGDSADDDNETTDTVEDQSFEEEEQADDTSDDSGDIDFEAEYKKLLEPFKANGKQMQVNSVEEAQQLMKMGAGFNKKMSILKPQLKIIKMLENNGLLDQDKLSFLIDVEKKDPTAIKKLINDADLSAYDLDTEDTGEYKPNDYGVSDTEVALDDVLTELKDTPTYNDLMSTVTRQWDKNSQRIVAENPHVLPVINDHMANGIYGQISGEVEKQRMLGNLSGMSDIEAYREVGDRLFAQGKFGNSNDTQTSTKQTKQAKQKVAQKKRAAAITKSSTNKPAKTQINPLAMSDEEILKLNL